MSQLNSKTTGCFATENYSYLQTNLFPFDQLDQEINNSIHLLEEKVTFKSNPVLDVVVDAKIGKY